MLLTELETSARTVNKRMTNHNTPQLSQMDLPVHCAAFPGLSLINTRAVLLCRFVQLHYGCQHEGEGDQAKHRRSILPTGVWNIISIDKISKSSSSFSLLGHAWWFRPLEENVGRSVLTVGASCCVGFWSYMLKFSLELIYCSFVDRDIFTVIWILEFYYSDLRYSVLAYF
jgi:hypothetical protein